VNHTVKQKKTGGKSKKKRGKQIEKKICVFRGMKRGRRKRPEKTRL